MSYNLTGLTASFTYGRLVQVIHGATDSYYDGFGNLLNLGSGTSTGPQGPTGPQGLSINWMGEWDSMMMYFYYDLITYNGVAYICISTLTGSAPWDSPDIDTIHWQQMLIGIAGTSGINGIDGSSGTSGINGLDGSSGSMGTSGSSGSQGTSGSSGTAGTRGTSGSAGTSGLSGISGGQVYYFNESVTQTPYKEFSPIATTTSQQTVTVTIARGVTSTIQSYLTPPTYPNVSVISAGIWSFYLHAYKENNNASFDIFCEVYSRTTGGTETLLFTTDAAPVTTNSPNPSMVLSDAYQGGFSINTTDRILVKVRATNTSNQSHSITFVTEGTTHYSFAQTTLGVTNGTSGTSGLTGSSGTSGSSGSSGTSGSQGDKGGLQYQLYDISGGTPITGKFTMYSSEGTWFDLRINVTDRLGNNNSGYFSQLVGSNGYIYITNNSNSIARATVYPFTNVTLVSGYYLFGLDFASGIETDLLLNDICALTIVINGVNGSSGTTGTSGSSGLLSLLGSTNNGVITLDGSKPNATVESNLTFDGNTLLVSGTVSTDKLKVNTGYSNGYIMTSDSNGNANWQNYGTAKEENYYFSISNTTDIRPIYSDSNVTFNWDETANQLEMVMNIAPSGSGDMRSLAYIVGGSTQNTFIVSTGVIYDLYAIGVAAGNRLEVFVTAENDINYPAYHITVYNTGESFQNIVWIKKIYKI